MSRHTCNSSAWTRLTAGNADCHVALLPSRQPAPWEVKTVAPLASRGQGSWLWRRLAATSEFSFHDRWEVDGSIEDVAGLFLNTAAISQWWPQLAGVSVGDSGRADGGARSFGARASGFLPYELALDFRVVRVRFPEQFSVELSGDLCGHGAGSLCQNGSRVAIDFDLSVRVARPILHVLSLVARPALSAQHRWVMRQGERGLRNTLSLRKTNGVAP